MIRFTWLQFRTQTVAAIGALMMVAVVLAVTGPHLVHLYDTTVAPCATHGDCQAATSAFLRNDEHLRTWLDILVIVVPGIVGIFWGAPLVARELETGTFQLAWTQSVTRTRWLAVKFAVVGVTSMAVAGLLSLIVTWWASPLDRAHMTRFGTFDQRDLVPIAYAAFACALGVTAGTLIRRTLPAMATTVVAFAGARVAVTQWVRPHLTAAAHTSLPVTAATDLGFTPSASGVTFVSNRPSIPNAWVLSSRIVNSSGHAATPKALHQFLQTTCPNIVNPAAPPTGISRAPADATGFRDCVTQISAKFHLAVTYQPANHYWPLQWYETAIFLGAALFLGGFCFWWVRHRIT
jgi:hypothetical protein